MITCNLMGGLGNQLFQIFTTISYAIKNHKQFKFLYSETLGDGVTITRKTYWGNFLYNLTPFLISEFPKDMKTIKENGFAFNDLNIDEFSQEDIFLYGYFQSYKYFNKYYEILTRIINLENQKNDLKQKLELPEKYFDNKISMHFRLGDYKNLQHIYKLATYEYYEKALKEIITRTKKDVYTVLYFCENNDEEDVLKTIRKLEEKFSRCKFERGLKTLADWKQLLLMSLCSHNIIANSSFSWWGAYFNSNKNKIVCYPSKWFSETCTHNTKDLCPPEWIKIDM
jgi:hypothetical protein